jgi:hypothetical protein
MAALKLRGPKAKILTLTVAQEEVWQLYAFKKEVPEMLKSPFNILRSMSWRQPPDWLRTYFW